MENNYEYIILDKAVSDMENIFDYISHTLMSENSALKLISKFEEKIELAASNPKLYPVVITDLSKYEYRKIVIENYIIAYRIIEKNETILILRVLNKLQDWQKLV